MAFIDLILTGIYIGSPPGSLMCLGSFYHLSCLCILTNKNKLLFHMTPADQSALFCSLVCLPGLVLSTVTRSPLDGNRTCFPSRVQFSEQHTGLQETAVFLAQLSMGLTFCACLYLVLPLSFPILHSLPASCTGPTMGKKQTQVLSCLGLQHLSVNDKNVIPYGCSTKILQFLENSGSNSSFIYYLFFLTFFIDFMNEGRGREI